MKNRETSKVPLEEPAGGSISPLAPLTSLRDLNLSGTQITDISVLSGLVNLQKLNLSCPNLADISALSGMANLTELYLVGNQVTDISPLAGCTNLQILYAANGIISDISPLAGCSNLETVTLVNQQITDISALSDLANLDDLNLNVNQITDFTPLSGLANLTYLGLMDNNVSDIGFLSGMTGLTMLDLRENQVSDISVIGDLPEISSLLLDHNLITDIAVLVNIPGLKSLFIPYNYLDLTPGSDDMNNLEILGSRLSEYNFAYRPQLSQVNSSPPVLNPVGNKTVQAGQTLEIFVSGTDPDSNPLTYSATGLPAGATFENQIFSWTPDAAGTYEGVTFTVSDGQYTDSETISITVTAASTEPMKYESYSAADANWDIFGDVWQAQTFTPQVSHTVTSVRLPLIRMGTASGNFVVSIRAVDSDGRPTGPDLASGSIPTGSIAAAWSPMRWYDVSLGSGYQMESGVKYAIVMRAPGQDNNNRCYNWVQRDGSYSGGWLCSSNDGGSTWDDVSSQTWDAAFEEWGTDMSP